MDFLNIYKKMKEEVTNPFSFKDEKDLLLQNLNNNFAFIKSKFLQGKVYISNSHEYPSVCSSTYLDNDLSALTRAGYIHPLNEGTFDHLRTLIKDIQEIYPNQWNLEIAYNKKSDIIILKGFSLHFPKIKLVNIRGASHMLRDVYSANSFYVTNGTSRTLNVGRLYSTRATVTREEHDAGYFHSHIPGSSIGNFRNWTRSSDNANFYHQMCLGGTDSGIQRVTSDYNQRTKTSAKFKELLLSIKGTLRYESLEGGPYRHIESIGRNSQNNQTRIYEEKPYRTGLSQNTLKSYTNFLLLNALKNDPNLSFRFNIKDNPFLYREVDFQDNVKLKQVLVASYRNLANKVNSPTDTIILEDKAHSSGVKRYQSNLANLSLVFKTPTGRGAKHVNPHYFFLPEESVTQGETEVVSYLGNKPTIFKGQFVQSKIIIVRGEGNQTTLTKRNPNSVDLEIEDNYLQQVKNILTNKITKNVFEARTEEVVS